MAKKRRFVSGLVLVFVALVSVFVPAVNAVSQDWYLCATDTRLNKTAPVDDTHSFTGWSEWEAEPAQSNLTMSSGTWTLHLEYYTPNQASGRLFVEVWNASTKVAEGYTSITTYYYDYVNVYMTGISADFKKGDSLKLKLNWVSDRDPAVDLDVQCGNGKSKLSSPSADPGYPIPELNTFVLSSVGLLALASYVAYRRKRI
ncbi:MAG: hypothetical protein WAV32_00155 [Halobacteriota archaeon]